MYVFSTDMENSTQSLSKLQDAITDELKHGFVEVNVTHSIWIVPSRYSDFKIIGRGAYGEVCSAYDSKLRRKVAVKKLLKPFKTSDYAIRTYRELRILSHVDHENMVCLIDAFSPQQSLETFNDLYLVTPLMAADLGTVIRNHELSDGHIRFFVYQMLRALKYLHSAGLIHRDLKPVNIAVNEDSELKLLDFGLARETVDTMSGYVATRWYRAPEIILTWTHYSEAVDIWSVACIMSELRYRRPLFEGQNYIDQLCAIMRLLGKPDHQYLSKLSDHARKYIDQLSIGQPQDFYEHFREFPPDGIDFLQKLLHIDPEMRLTAAQALAHPYLQTYHEEKDEPTGILYEDPLEMKENITADQWKGHIWKHLNTFVPKSNSLSK